MLVSITIKNFAVIKQLTLNFEAGLTSLTGETGAGKSIIIDALNLVLGGRADLTMLPAAANTAEISVTFTYATTSSIAKWLEAHQYATEDNYLILRRIISRNGHGRSTINDTPVTLQTLHKLGRLLVDIHGQYDNQLLFDSEHQLALLDALAGADGALNTVQAAYVTWKQLDEERTHLQKLLKNATTETELLQYQLKEFNGLDCSVSHLTQLRSEHQELKKKLRLGEELAVMRQILDSSLFDQLNKMRRSLHSCLDKDSNFKIEAELLNNATVNLEELAAQIGRRLNNAENSTERAQNIEAELDRIYTLAMKHHVDPTELETIAKQLTTNLAEIANAEANYHDIEARLSAATNAYLAAANALSKLRTEAANRLTKQLTETLPKLALPKSKFVAELIPSSSVKPEPHGLETVIFKIALNPGSPLMPLAKVASGGELARISLALRAVSITKQLLPTLIFDEIDTGIGGLTAHTVGALLRTLANEVQVLVITHLPQVAAAAHQQYQVTKLFTHDDTSIIITPLSPEARLTELARMLGSGTPSDAILTHVKKLLEIYSKT